MTYVFSKFCIRCSCNSACVCRVISEDELEESRKEGMSDDEPFEPYSDKRWVSVSVVEKMADARSPGVNLSNFSARARKGTILKRRRSPKTPEESKVKKKPGPKPGWKNKFKPKG